MKSEIIEKVVNAVIYEGYMLYPYRRSALKNQHRWNYGIVHPDGIEPCRMTTECLLECDDADSPEVEIEVRFLQIAADAPDQDPVERQLKTSITAPDNPVSTVPFAFGKLHGVIDTQVTRVQEHLFKVAVHIRNQGLLEAGEDVLSRSLIAAHTILAAQSGQFVSLLDPPSLFVKAAADCRNVGTWPVLVGRAPERDCILSSPIILYDYPQIAPESPGDFFDGGEIDELLTLRVLTLTESEKEEVRQSGDRAREILDRCESLPADDFMKLHGVMRSAAHEIKTGDRVRLKPKPGGDVFDIVLAGRVAIVESVEQDFEDRFHVSVVIEDDPGRDLGMMRQPGHRFFFSPEELELLP
jgi:hypothetical protein